MRGKQNCHELRDLLHNIKVKIRLADPDLWSNGSTPSALHLDMRQLLRTCTCTLTWIEIGVPVSPGCFLDLTDSFG
jgi:hypothetical protein